MTNELAPLPQSVSVEQANAWITLAEGKNNLMQHLSAQALAMQKILIDLNKCEDYRKIDESLATYRKQHDEMVKTRKAFTSQIEKGIIQPLMAKEKEVDPKENPLYNEMANKSLQKRKEEAAAAEKENQRLRELGEFKAHVQNGWLAVELAYTKALRDKVLENYTTDLSAGVRRRIEDTTLTLDSVEIPKMEKFTASIITREEMASIYNSIPKPNFDDICVKIGTEQVDMYRNFESDLKNKEQAIAHQKNAALLKEKDDENKAKSEAAITTLITTSEVVEVVAPKIKKSVKVVIVESPEWAKAVIAAFITNLNDLAPYIRVKSWSKLSIGQMADYLGKYATDTGDSFAGLQLEELEK